MNSAGRPPPSQLHAEPQGRITKTMRFLVSCKCLGAARAEAEDILLVELSGRYLGLPLKTG